MKLASGQAHLPLAYISTSRKMISKLKSVFLKFTLTRGVDTKIRLGFLLVNVVSYVVPKITTFLRESPQSRQRSSDYYYVVDGFKFARL